MCYIDRLSPFQELHSVLSVSIFLAAEEQRTITVAHDGVCRILVDGFELRLGLQNDRRGNFTASDGGDKLVELRDLADISKLIKQAADMDRQSAVIDIICLVTEQIEHLGVHDRHDEIEGIICVGNDDEQCRLTVSESIQFQFVVAPSAPAALQCQREQVLRHRKSGSILLFCQQLICIFGTA